jgi:hypothetical protein
MPDALRVLELNVAAIPPCFGAMAASDASEHVLSPHTVEPKAGENEVAGVAIVGSTSTDAYSIAGGVSLAFPTIAIMQHWRSYNQGRFCVQQQRLWPRLASHRGSTG